MPEQLDPEQLHTAGEANHSASSPEIATTINQCLRYTLELRNAIARKRIWMAQELLHRIRTLLMHLFAITHEEIRAVQGFEAHASGDLQNLMKNLVAQPDLPALQTTYENLLHLLQNNLTAFMGDDFKFTDAQQSIIEKLRGIA